MNVIESGHWTAQIIHRRNNRWDRERLVPQTFRLGTNNVLVPQLLGRSFQKARNFTVSSHQNAGFSIWVFKNFPGVIPPDPHSGRGWPPPAPNTQQGLCPGAGRKLSGVGTQTLAPPLNFSAVVAPLKSYVSANWHSNNNMLRIRMCNNNANHITDTSKTAVHTQVTQLRARYQHAQQLNSHHTIWFRVQFRPDFKNLNPAHLYE